MKLAYALAAGLLSSCAAARPSPTAIDIPPQLAELPVQVRVERSGYGSPWDILTAFDNALADVSSQRLMWWTAKKRHEALADSDVVAVIIAVNLNNPQKQLGGGISDLVSAFDNVARGGHHVLDVEVVIRHGATVIDQAMESRRMTDPGQSAQMLAYTLRRVLTTILSSGRLQAYGVEYAARVQRDRESRERELELARIAAANKADDDAWAESRSGACCEPASLVACEGVKQYLARFEVGRHSRDARECFASAQPRLVYIADEQAWAAGSSDSCRAARSSTACDGVTRYLADRPNGRHATEAKALLSSASRKLAAQKVREAEKAREVRHPAGRLAAERKAARQAVEGKQASRAGQSTQARRNAKADRLAPGILQRCLHPSSPGTLACIQNCRETVSPTSVDEGGLNLQAKCTVACKMSDDACLEGSMYIKALREGRAD